MKPTYRIEPAPDSRFVVVRFHRTWWKEHRTILANVERLQEAEMQLCFALDREFMRELDRKHYTSVEYDVEALYPRADEEQVYTALVLQSTLPPQEHEVYYAQDRFTDMYEKMKGKKLDLVEGRLLMGRYMTWYAKENPEYFDPRRNLNYGESVDPYHRRMPSPLNAPMSASGMKILQDTMTRGYRRLVDKLTGRVP